MNLAENWTGDPKLLLKNPVKISEPEFSNSSGRGRKVRIQA